MALSRDSRMDRRQQMLRDASIAEGAPGSDRVNRSSAAAADDSTRDGARGRRNPGYSQDVRHACGVRLVQLIPVRMLSFTAVVGAFVGVTATLLAAHYMIYVTGSLGWYGHPLAVSLDATHPQSIASWFGSHLWLLCLGATILTFQLRRHKLDDYSGEYRLWFWLVITCLLASIDSTTHLTELLGYSLDRWSQLNLGENWTGKAVVHATMAVLVSVLGVRLCTELKSVPLSLICWLGGLVAWAGSAALAQETLRLDMTLQMRYWLRAALWLGGLTAVWVASLAYLRHVYIEAQHRFLARGKLARRSTTKSDGRGREKVGGKLSPRAMWQSLPGLGRRGSHDEEESESERPTRRRAAKTAATQLASESVSDKSGDAQEGKRRRFSLWPSRGNNEDDAPEFRKVGREPIASGAQNRETKRTEAAAAKEAKLAEQQARQKEREALKQEHQAQRQAAREAKRAAKKSGSGKRFFLLAAFSAIGGLFGKLKLPSFSGLKLQPPETEEPASNTRPQSSSQGLRPVMANKPLPGTSRPTQTDDDDEDDSQDSDRHLSRAERKRLRRQGRAA